MWDANDIHARLAATRAADPDLQGFGASRHRHQLGQVLTETEVTSFEAEHGVTLPTAYRSLLDVGNGGAGPHHGLFPLNGDGMRDVGCDERSQPHYLATPFPHTDAWNPTGTQLE